MNGYTIFEFLGLHMYRVKLNSPRKVMIEIIVIIHKTVIRATIRDLMN